MTRLWTDGATWLGARARSDNHAGLAQHRWGCCCSSLRYWRSTFRAHRIGAVMSFDGSPSSTT